MNSKDIRKKRNLFLIVGIPSIIAAMSAVSYLAVTKDGSNILLSTPNKGDLVVMMKQSGMGWGYNKFDLTLGKVGQPVFKDTACCITASFSPDAKILVGMGTPSDVGETHAFVLNTVNFKTGAHAQFNSDIFASDLPSWNPQGTLIAYKHLDSMQSASRLGILDVKTGRRSVHGIPLRQIKTPVWNLDGTGIVAEAIDDTSSKLYFFSLTDNAWTKLPIASNITTTRISRQPSKNIFVFCGSVDTAQGLFKLDLDSNMITQLFKGECKEASISNSGDSIAVIVNNKGKSQLAVYFISKRQLIVYPTADEVYWPSWI